MDSKKNFGVTTSRGPRERLRIGSDRWRLRELEFIRDRLLRQGKKSKAAAVTAACQALKHRLEEKQ